MTYVDKYMGEHWDGGPSFAVSAITLRREVVATTNSGIGAEVVEDFETQFPGDNVEPELAYWVKILPIDDSAGPPTLIAVALPKE